MSSPESFLNHTYHVHNLDPVLLPIYGNIGIRWYGLSYMVGFICSYFLIRWLCEKQKMGLTKDMVADFVTYCAIGTMAGGRLGYCLFYSPDLFIKFKPDFPFWGVLAVNEGGMASHGGMIGIVVGVWLFARKYGISTLYLLDLVCVCGPIGIFFGRLANFINGELVGRPIQSFVSWAVKFPTDMLSWTIHDRDKYASLSNIYQTLGGSLDQWKTWVDTFDAFSIGQMNSFINRLIVETHSHNQEVLKVIEPLLIPRHPSQLYGALLEGLSVFIILFLMWRTPKKLGVIAASFGVLYSIARVIVEFYRMPDAHIGLQLFDLSRGQWLSIVLACIALVLGVLWNRTVTVVAPGWGRVESIRLSRK
ncbi:MAG: prolipoprotein diacylglyceryl transferase [Bdellovibrionaceae bacterium]|nr:prolipoprotein diacylglyceryl transferase [Pseudobdellovibrionaceae bacterium]